MKKYCAPIVALITCFLFLFSACFLAGCSQDITDDHLRIWTNNEEGFRQMERIMKDSSVEDETRVKALYYLAEADKAAQIGRILYASSSPAGIAGGLRDKLLPELTSENLDAVRVKSALFSLAPFLDDVEKDALLGKIAAWAFEDLSKESSTEQIKQQVEHRIGMSEIERLGKHGVRGAALLISRGFQVSALFEYAEGFSSDETQKLLLDALISYETLPQISLTRNQLSRFYGLGTLEAGAHLMKLYRSLGEEDKDLALEAFNGAQEIFSGEENRKKGKQIIIDTVRPLLAADNPDDRWYATAQLLALNGAGSLEETFAALKDDNVYANGIIDPLKSMVDFCRDGIVPLKETGLKKSLAMVNSGNRVQKTAGLICLKAFNHLPSKKEMKKLKSSSESLHSLLGGKLTVNGLVLNLESSVAYMNTVKAALEAKTLDQKAFDSKQFFAVVTMDKTGDEFEEEVEARHSESMTESE